MNSNKYLAAVVFLVSLVTPNMFGYEQGGQGPRQKKPYQEWSEAEASNLLFESPRGAK